MLDQLLEVLYERDKLASDRQETVAALKNLPNEELHAIVRGESKLASGDACWLDAFRGSDLYDDALQLEEQMLKVDLAQDQQQQQHRSESDPVWRMRDALRIKRRLLELELRKQEVEALRGEDVDGSEEVEAPKEAAAGILTKAKRGLKRGGELLTGSRARSLGQWAERKRGSPLEGTYKILADNEKANVMRARVRVGAGALGIAALGNAALAKRRKKAEDSDTASKQASVTAEKIASMRMARVVSDLEKEAVVRAIRQALPAVGKFLKGTGSDAVAAAKSGGASALGKTLKGQATKGISSAGKWTAKNPMAAGAVGAGALGTAALGGYAAG